MDLEEVQVANYLKGHPDFLQNWLERNADKELLDVLHKKWGGQNDNSNTSKF